MNSSQTKPTDDKKTSTWRDDLKLIWKVAGRIELVLTALTASLPTIFAVLFKQEADTPVKIFETLVLTWPFTMAIWLIATGVVRGWFNSLYAFGAWSLFIIGVLSSIASYFGVRGGIRTLGDLRDLYPNLWWGLPAPLSLPVVFLAYLLNYWQAYKPHEFISAVIVGGFLTWVWAWKLLPRLRQSKDLIISKSKTQKNDLTE
jgi:hypothetical protein